jgi:hypothetical protein
MNIIILQVLHVIDDIFDPSLVQQFKLLRIWRGQIHGGLIVQDLGNVVELYRLRLLLWLEDCPEINVDLIHRYLPVYSPFVLRYISMQVSGSIGKVWRHQSCHSRLFLN